MTANELEQGDYFLFDTPCSDLYEAIDFDTCRPVMFQTADGWKPYHELQDESYMNPEAIVRRVKLVVE